jgi:hypothetical protein
VAMSTWRRTPSGGEGTGAKRHITVRLFALVCISETPGKEPLGTSGAWGKGVLKAENVAHADLLSGPKNRASY